MIFLVKNDNPSIILMWYSEGLEMSFEVQFSIQCFRRRPL